MTEKLVSVVVPVYNVEKYLDRCLESITGQTYKNLEIILVDDGSPDNCPQICEEWQEKDPRIKVIHKENAGLGMARKTGFEAVTGEFVFFFDSDDYVAEDLVERCIFTALKHKADTVAYGRSEVYPDGRIKSSQNIFKEQIYEADAVKNVFLPKLFNYGLGCGVSQWSKMFSVGIIKDNNINFSSERDVISEDSIFSLEYFSKACRVALIPDKLYFYRKNEASLTHKFDTDRGIKNNEFLRKSFEKINAALGKRTLIQFRSVIEAHPEIIPELSDYLAFKRKVWVGLLNKVKTELDKVILEYEKCQTLIETIKEEANRQHSQWDIVLDIFKSRFTVPFTISVPNKNDVALLGEMPEFVFKYKDMETGDEQEISRKNLERVLSQGEKRALFLLNIINDLEALKLSGKEYLIVTDDIAESFDYKNKYAIIEYLQEMMEAANLKFVVLTHNFDFYRTVALRAKGKVRPAMVQRVNNGLEIGDPKYVYKTPFELIRKGIKRHNDKDLITSIPFVRNIIEYTSGTDNNTNYQLLTSLLHLKSTTKTITFKQLEDIYKDELRDVDFDFSESRETDKVYYLILNEAKKIRFNNNDAMDLDGKVVISMAIRLLAEEYMINQLLAVGCPRESIEGISTMQTGGLVELFKKFCPTQTGELKTLNKVLLMSSENIHINSFMFEPLIDISIKSLVDLFGDICILQPPVYSE
jgi:glycosyltransferase involved in cell wall biosynthesis